MRNCFPQRGIRGQIRIIDPAAEHTDRLSARKQRALVSSCVDAQRTAADDHGAALGKPIPQAVRNPLPHQRRFPRPHNGDGGDFRKIRKFSLYIQYSRRVMNLPQKEGIFPVLRRENRLPQLHTMGELGLRLL